MSGASGEDERFIFYRGLGRFTEPLRVESLSDGTLRISNDSDQDVASLFLLFASSTGGAVQSIGQLAAHERRTIAPDLRIEPTDTYVSHASSAVAQSLEKSGLYRDEAQAMVDTWSRSYFRGPGLRVLYVAPRAWTDALLPIQIDPAPSEIVRTLVGRIEVLTTAEEQAILHDVTTASSGGPAIAVDAYGRFTEAKLRRAAELAGDPKAKAYAAQLADFASTMP